MNETPQIQNDKPASEPKKLLPLPDVGDLLFIGIMHILLFGRPDYMFQDASVGWHLTAGKWIFENHAIPRVDLFSYTFPEKPWVAYEWLFDLIAYMLTLAGGFNLLAVVVAGIIAFVLLKVYDRAREDGGPLELVVPVAIFGILASAIHWLARPHIVTLLCVFFYLKKLEDYWRGTISSTKLYLFLGLLMILWVNCHPAFLVGIALIGIYFIAAILVQLFGTNMADNFSKPKTYFIAGVVVVIATLLNPYGSELYKYILEYLKGSTVLANTDEFRSPSFQLDLFRFDIHSFCFEILMGFFLTGLAIAKKRPSLPYFATCLLFMHMALSAVRSIPLYAIASVPALGLLYSKTILEDSKRSLFETFPKLKTRFERSFKPFKEFANQENQCKMHILPMLYVSFLIVVALLGGGFGDTKILTAGFSKTEMPTKTLDYIKENNLAANRGFNFDNWGGLIRYKLDQRVFIDDRADFYGEEFYKKYGSVLQAQPDWDKLLDEQNIQWVLIPKTAPLTQALRQNSHWAVACEDPGSEDFKDAGGILFVRRD